MAPEALLELLIQSKERNESLNITGMLLYDKGTFLQVIEGPEITLEPLYTAIQNDHRHKDLLLIQNKTIPERSFPNWSMRIKNMSHQRFTDESLFMNWLNKEFEQNCFNEQKNLAHNLVLSFLRAASIHNHPPFEPRFA